jgi:hypothetical protein
MSSAASIQTWPFGCCLKMSKGADNEALRPQGSWAKDGAYRHQNQWCEGSGRTGGCVGFSIP